MAVSSVEVGVPIGIIPTTDSGMEKSVEQLENESRQILLQAELDKPKASSDQAVLSKESREKSSASEASQSRSDQWTLETDPLWPFLLTWNPDPGKSAEEMIKQLMELYKALLANLMDQSTGQSQYVQLLRLEQVLSEALNRMWDQQLSAISLLFEGQGTKEQVLQIKGEIYRMITGQRLGKGQVESFWNMGKQGRSSVYRSTLIPDGAETTKVAQGLKAAKTYQIPDRQVMIYQPVKGKVEVTLDTPMKLSAMEKRQEAVQTSSLRGDISLRGTVSGEITGRDIKLANQISGYLTSSDNILTSSTLEGRSEELQGVLSSVLQIQSREFVRYSSMGKTMSHLIYDIVDRMIDQYFHKAQEAVDQRSGGQIPEKNQNFMLKDAYRVHYYITDLYQKSMKAESAISEGIRYAIEVFGKKKSDESFKKMARYGEDAGFFKHNQMNESLQLLWSDLKLGKEILEKNWITFLSYTGMVGKRNISLIPLDQSFWGALINPEDSDTSMSLGRYLAVFSGVLCFGFVLLIYLRLI